MRNNPRNGRLYVMLSAVVVMSAAALLLEASEHNNPGSIPDKIQYRKGMRYFSKCVADVNCRQSPNCEGVIPGQACVFCDYQRSQEKCVMALTTICTWADMGPTATGCGVRYVGTCLGSGTDSPCLNPLPYGRCSRIICVTSPIWQ